MLSLESKTLIATLLHETVVPVDGTVTPYFAGVLIATVTFLVALPSAGLVGDKREADRADDPADVLR
jgi:hypothetical protein